MRKLIARFRRWNKWRVVHCYVCGATSGRMFQDGAERMARNHVHNTGHVNITIGRKF